MDEDDRRSVRADAGFAQHLCALCLHLGLGGVNIGHFEADVVLSARRVLLEELHDRRVLAQRLDQLDLAVGRIDEAHTHALRRQVERLVDLRRAKQADVHFDRFLRSEEHTSELQSLMRISYAVFCLKKKKKKTTKTSHNH